MSNAGFGFGLNRLPINIDFIHANSVVPSAGFNGTIGSGFGGSYGAVPVDPTRTTAKPACRLLTPDRQWFTSSQLVGVIAMANDNGSLLDNLGLERVIVHFEGNTVEVTRPTFQTFNDTNGNPVTYLGWWCFLKHNGTNGHGRVYFEAVPKDATMQRRVMGPYSFSPQPAVHDGEYEIAPTPAEITGVRYKTLMGAINYAKGQGKKNPLFTITESGDYDLVDSTTGGSQWTNPGFYTIQATVPASIARQGPYTGDGAGIMLTPRVPIRVCGSNMTIDFQNIFEIRAGSIAGLHWFDGVLLTNTHPDGRNMTRRGRVPNTFGTLVRDQPFFTECTFTRVHVPCLEASLVRGCHVENVSQDIVSNARCVVSSTFNDQSSEFFNASGPAFTVQYTGSEATASLARSGGTEGSGTGGGIYTAKWGANSATFEVGQSEAHYLGTAGDGYWFSDVVAWLNTLPDFTATLIDDTFYAVTGSLTGFKGQGFGDTDCKAAPLEVVSHTDKHGDWYQHATGHLENVVVMNNRCWDIYTQFIFLCPISNGSGKDMFFVNNSAYINPAPGYVSQFGRTNVIHSHLVLAHNTLSNQGMSIRRDNSGYDLDAYCMWANNSIEGFGWSQNNIDFDVTVKNMHLHSGAIPPGNATGTTLGGNETTLYVDAPLGDFTPQGALLTTGYPPVVKYDQQRTAYPAFAAAGAIAAAAPEYEPPEPSLDPVGDLLALMNAAGGLSSFHDFATATDVAGTLTSVDQTTNGNNFTQATGGNKPTIGAGGATFAATSFMGQAISGGTFTVVVSFTRDPASTLGNMLSDNLTNAPVTYNSASGVSHAIVVRVGVGDDAEIRARRDTLHAALNGKQAVMMENFDLSSSSELRIGRTINGLVGVVHKVAIIDEDEFPDNLLDVRYLAQQAVMT